MRTIPLHTLAFAVTAAGAGWLIACTTSSAPEDLTPATSTAGPQAGTGDAVTAPQSGPGCEELGALSATALTGALDTTNAPESQTTSFTLPNRPSLTKVKVVAVGTPSELVGKGAVLGASDNASYATCTHCLIVAIGCTATSCADAAIFFPRAGTGTFTALAEGSGQPFAGTFTDVELEQVTLDPQTLASTPVVNGACMRVASLTFGASPTEPSSADAGGSTTSSGGSSSGDADSGEAGADSGTDSGSKFDAGVANGGTSSTSSGGGKSSTSSGGTTKGGTGLPTKLL